MRACMCVYIYICMYVCLCACMHACIAGWLAGWLDGWMDGWMDVSVHLCMYVCMYVCIYVCTSVCTVVHRLSFSTQAYRRFIGTILSCVPTGADMCVDMYAWAYVRMSGYFSGLIMDVTTLWVSDCYLCVSLLETLFMGYDLFMYVSSSSMH